MIKRISESTVNVRNTGIYDLDTPFPKLVSLVNSFDCNTGYLEATVLPTPFDFEVIGTIFFDRKLRFFYMK